MQSANWTSLDEPVLVGLPAPTPVGAELEPLDESPHAVTAKTVTRTAASRGQTLLARRRRTRIFPGWVMVIVLDSFLRIGSGGLLTP
jgi:hypothetical protein